MGNIVYDLDIQNGILNINYSSFYGEKCFPLKGKLTSDGKTFLVHSNSLSSCQSLSQTEISGIKKYVSEDSWLKRGVEIAFMH